MAVDDDRIESGDELDETRLAGSDVATPLTPRSGTSPGTSSSGATTTDGWLTSSGAIDHGRFQPGSILGARYRIVGRLGRGGMGEVFRADDLKLGQPVALKFLPPDVDQDPARLTQLHTEVRTARLVSHPNVCRVFDIDEVEGHTFLSMEYVDGEDLSALLRRIGRFPQERGLEIARQICAGLAAAHERGVVHRDFKPANVMLDAAGRVRITDFGLAGVSGEALRAGTPAYMAPEQLSGAEVTPRSDIYALGLVLYEIFTGKRALEGTTLAELIRRREQAGITPPSAIVRDLDEGIETAILRCLRPDPDERPASAMRVAALLPGGDPLAAVLAAGETPSPEMVAAAGSTEAISARAALAGAVWIAASLIAVLLMFERVMLINRVSTPKSPAALQDRAEEALAKLGYGGQTRDRAFGLGVSMDYPRYIAATSSAPDRWQQLAGTRPETLYGWYRTSPVALVPLGNELPVTGINPPLRAAGMALIVVDASGRLSEFAAVPSPTDDNGSNPVPFDWKVMFDAAALDMSRFRSVDPRWVPVSFADQRAAWEGELAEQTGQTLRVEAAAHAGKPVSFVITGPWSRSARSPATPQASLALTDRILNVFTSLVLPGLMVAAAILARHNIKLGRGDRRGALRAASVLFFVRMAAWLLALRPLGVLATDLTRFFAATASALFDAAVLWMTYLAIEPYIRKLSPDSLIGWTRLIGGQWKDPLVARDVLIGVSAGLAMTVLYGAHNLIPPLFGRPEPMPFVLNDTNVLLGARFVLARMAGQLSNALLQGMLAVVGLVALMIPLRRKWLTHLVGSLIYVWVVIQGMFNPGTPLLDIAIGLGIIAIFAGIILYGGLLATIAALSTHFILLRAPLTTDFSSWRANVGLTYILVLAVVGLGAAYVARTAAGGPLRQRPV